MNFIRSYFKVLSFTGVVTLIFIYAAIWTQVNIRSDALTATDYIAFYTAGKVAQKHGYQDVYNITYQQEIQESLSGYSLSEDEPLLYNHIPFLLPLLSLLTQDNYRTSLITWDLIQIMIFAASFYVLNLLLPNTWQKKTKNNIIISIALFFPVFISILIGQDTSFLFFGISLFAFGLLTRNDFLAGLGLALTTVRPHITLILALPLFFKNKKAFTFFTLTGSVLALFSISLIGVDGVKDFINILTISSKGAWQGMNEIDMLNLIGLLSRITPSLTTNIIRTIGWASYGLAIIALCVYSAASKSSLEVFLGLLISASIFFSPHLHYHDLSILAIPIFLICLSPVFEKHKETLPFFLLLLSFVLLLSMGSWLYSFLPYLLIISIVLLLVREQGFTHQTPSLIES